MLVYNGTGKTKTGDLRITRAIGGLLIASSRKVEELTNERITIYIERANGSNIELCNNVNLKHFILGSTFGNTLIKSDTANSVGCQALCEIALDGAIMLGSNESIIVELNNLVSAQTYTVYGIEYPQASEQALTYERKTILSDETKKTYNVNGAVLMLLEGDSVEDVEFTFTNGVRTKYSRIELEALAFDVENIITADAGGNISLNTGGVIMFPLQDITTVTIEKESGKVELTLLM